MPSEKRLEMRRLSVTDILDRIRKGTTFTATTKDGAFTISVEKYVPYICTAIHNGHAVRAGLLTKIALSEEERLREEDPATGDFIASLPIRLIANDSRYQYDLNRPQDQCIYDEAWGKKVWAEPLSETDIRTSLRRHQAFYKVLDALVTRLAGRFGGVVIYDVHSFNYKREGMPKSTPLFNLGTENIPRDRFGTYIDILVEGLRKVDLGSMSGRVAVNEVFYGRGYLLKHVMEKFPNTLVLPLEVKKVYCDEETGDEFPGIIEAIQVGLKKAIVETSHSFARNETSFRGKRKYALLSDRLEDVVKKVDREVYSLVRNVDVLHHVTPSNLEFQKGKFLRLDGRHTPVFRYHPYRIEPGELKRRLLEVPISEIRDITIQQLYADIIDEYIRKVDLVTSRGTPQFLYTSLLVYGEPSATDISNAEFILHCMDREGEGNGGTITTEEAARRFLETADVYGFNCKVEVVKNLSAKAMVLSAKKTLRLRQGTMFDSVQLEALRNHEIGVHMLTTTNASLNTLKLLTLGLPGSTATQEGLAILAEFMSGHMTLRRLKELAIRVIAVGMMVHGSTFREVVDRLVEEFDYDLEEAFYLSARVFRGGGFTKDYLYLSGFSDVHNHFTSGGSLEPLLVGKSSLQYHDLIRELIARGMVTPPRYYTTVLKDGPGPDQVLDYIVGSLK